MKPTEEHITEIAELLDVGMLCFFHRPTGTIEYYPDPMDSYMESEFWEEAMEKVEEDRENYDVFEKMDSREGFQVMVDFADSLSDARFRDRIVEKLSRGKPFQNFKMLIDDSDYRQDWFDFKKQAYIDFVRGQIVPD